MPRHVGYILADQVMCSASKCSARVQSAVRKCASKRWSALLTQKDSRIAPKMRCRLGEANWAAFVQYAKAHHKKAFTRAFAPASGVLRCAGKLDGSRCPNDVRIDLTRVSSIECETRLAGLHLDHTHDVNHICEVWSDALPNEPRSWDDGIDGALVAHLLFGTDTLSDRFYEQQLVFRCGSVRGVDGQYARDFCHNLAGAHYKHSIEVGDLDMKHRSATENVPLVSP